MAQAEIDGEGWRGGGESNFVVAWVGPLDLIKETTSCPQFPFCEGSRVLEPDVSRVASSQNTRAREFPELRAFVSCSSELHLHSQESSVIPHCVRVERKGGQTLAGSALGC